MTKHANLPPSGSGRWVPCPGSIVMEEAIPAEHRKSSGVFAQLGTAAHGLLERCMSKDEEPSDYLGRIVELVGEDEDVSILKPKARAPKDGSGRVWFAVDEDMAEAVDTAVGYVRARLGELGGDLGLEERVRVLVDRDDCFGTADVSVDAWPDVLEVADYKNGSGVAVEVEGNHQIRCYLLGKAEATSFSHDRYVGTVIQPRKAHSDGPVRSEELTRGELLEFRTTLAVAAVNVDEAREILEIRGDARELYAKGYLVAGDQCRWCEAVQECPAALAKAAEVAGADFDEEPSEPLTVESDPDLLGRLLRWVPFIDGWVRAVEAHAQRVAEAGGHVDGHKMVHKGSKRRWRDEVTRLDEAGESITVQLTPTMLLEIMNDEFFVSYEDMTTLPGTITGPQAEKLVDKDRRAEFGALLLHKPDGPLTLVPEDDRRSEVTVDPASDFPDDGED